MRLVDEDVIDAEFVEYQSVVFFVASQQVLQTLGAVGFLLFDGFDQVAIHAPVGRVLAEQLIVFLDLLPKEFFLIVPGHPDPLEGTVGDDDAVPVAAGDFGGEHLAPVAGEIFLGGHEQPGVRIELHELPGELFEQMVGNDVHRLVHQTGLFHLHAGRGHGEGLAGADGVGQECVAGTHPPPDRVFLVRPEIHGLVHPREIKMRAVEDPGTEVVVSVVVKSHEPFGPDRIGEDPGAKTFLDEFLFLAGGHRVFPVDDPFLAFTGMHRVIDRRRLHVEGKFEQPRAVGSQGSVLGSRGHRHPGGMARFQAPDGVFFEMGDRHGRP